MMLKRTKVAAIGAAAAAMTMPAAPAQAQTFWIGQIVQVGFNFCPRTTANADGQLLAIASHTALFSLYGTTYGGDGRTTFALPDLRGRSAISTGNGPGLSPYTMGQRGGAERVTLTIAEMPAHSHAAALRANDTVAVNAPEPTNNSIGGNTTGNRFSTAAPDANMHPGSIQVGNTGGNQSHENRAPFLVTRYCVVMQGTFPSRN
jgi:microcystin-dependent protein